MATVNVAPVEFEACLNDSPEFRTLLERHRESNVYVQQWLTDVVGIARQSAFNGRALLNDLRALGTCLPALNFEGAGEYEPTESERVIDGALHRFGEVLSDIEEHRAMMLQQIQHTLVEPLERLYTADLAQVTELQQSYLRQREKYYACLEKPLSKKAGASAAEQRAMETEKGKWHEVSLTYVAKVNELAEARKLEIVEKTLAHMYATRTFFHQGHDALQSLDGYMSDLSQKLQSAHDTLLAKNERVAKLKRDTHDAHRFPVARAKACETTGKKEGQLNMKGGLKGNKGGWGRCYCKFDRETRSFKAAHLDQPSELMAFEVENCQQPSHSNFDRDHCFQVACADSKVLVLQAFSQNDRNEWIAAFGGLEPVKVARRSKPGAKQEGRPLLVVDERGVAFTKRVAAFVEKEYLCEQGLYRLSGQKSKVVAMFEAAILRGKLVGFDGVDVSTATSALKHYFRELSEPVLTFRAHKAFIHAAQLDEPVARTKALREALLSLPPANYELVEILVAHLRRISEKASQNKMKASNLGVVFGPTLMRPEVESVYGIGQIKYQNIVVEKLVLDFDVLFSDLDPDQAAQAALDKIMPATVTTAQRKRATGRKLPVPGQRKLPTPPKGLKAKTPSDSVRHKLRTRASQKRKTTADVVRTLKETQSHKLIGFTVRAVHKCTAEDPSEVSFERGQLITEVSDTDEDGWLIGTVIETGKRGLFPVNFVEYLPDLSGPD